MSGADDEAKLAYLAKHRVPVLLDVMVSRLLEAMPDDPAAFLSALDARQLSDGAGSPVATNGSQKTMEKQGSIRKTSVEGAQPRRASFQGGVRFGGGDEGSEGPAPKKKAGIVEGPPKRKPAEAGGEKTSKQAISNIKSVRRAFFESYAKEEWGNTNVRCVHIGSIALALSYLIKGKRDEPVAKRVTTEDVFFYARLPLHYVSNSGITLAELYDIAVTFVNKDPRFKRTTDVQLVHFDTRLLEGEVDASSGIQSGDRGPSVTLPAFRKAMERDSRDDRHIRVFNFDPFVAEQASLALLEEEDEDEDEEEKAKRMPKAKRKNRGAYAVFTEFNAFKAAVKLSECNIEEEVKVRYREVLLTAMYKACCAIDAFSKRPRGYIEFRGDAADFENVEVDPDDEVDTHWKTPCCVDDELLDAVPRTARGTSLTDAASHISPHAIAVAFGLHLIQGTSQQIGINIGDIMSTNQMPLHVMINESMVLDQVQAYTQSYIEKKGLLEQIGVSAHNISTVEGVEDAAPSMSVMDLESYLNGVMKATTDPKEPAVVMVVNFDVNTAHNVLGLEQGSVPSHWGVVVSYDQEEQLVRIGDIMPKKFCKHWNVPLTRLHTALTGKGFLLFSRLNNGVPPKISGVPTIPRPVSANTRHTADRHSNPVVVGDPLQTFEFPSSIYCITAVALAFSRLQFPTSVEDVIYKSGIDISFLLSDHVSLHDIRRVAAYVVKEQSIPLTTHVSICDIGVDGKPHFTEEEFRQVLEKNVPNAAEFCVVLNFNAESVHSHQHFHTHNGGDYAIVLAYDPSSRMVTCCDVNPQKYYRTWTAPADVVYSAMKEEDYASKRPRGYMLVEKKPPPASQQRQFDVRRVKNRHPLKVPTSPHISALAFALSELGSVCAPEDIFYTAYDAIRQTNAEAPAMFSLNSIKTAITLSGMAELGRSYASTHNIHKAVSIRPISEENPITLADFETEIQSAVSGLHVLIVLYSSGLAHNARGGEVSSALVKSYNKSTNTVTLSDTNTTKYAYEWNITPDNLLKCCTGEGETRGFVRVGK